MAKRLMAALLIAALFFSLPAMQTCASAAQQASASTSFAGSPWAQISNIEIAAASINGVVVPYGEEFSFNEIVGPRSSAYGYQSARNGRGVKVIGGGVAQAASTLYLALKQLGSDIEFTQLKTYGSKFSDDYVESGDEAILVDYSSGTDFSFINYGDDLTIEMWTTDGALHCSLTTEEINEEAFHISIESADLQPAFRKSVSSAAIPLKGDAAMRNNILLAAGSINDTVLSQGDMFSFNASVGPREERYGYQAALNGRGVKVTGGGVAQVASAIWLAVKDMDDIAIVEKSTYGSRYNQDYVSSSNDAISTDYKDDLDFSFRNTGDMPITISVYVSGDTLICDIFQN